MQILYEPQTSTFRIRYAPDGPETMLRDAEMARVPAVLIRISLSSPNSWVGLLTDRDLDDIGFPR